MSTTPLKVAVTGAAGQIGYSLLFRLASGSLLGRRPPDRAASARDRAGPEGARGCRDGARRLRVLDAGRRRDRRGPDKIFDGVNLALLVGARPRGPGMERGDLLEANGAIFTAQGKALNEVAADDIRIGVTGNPANTNALIAMTNAPDIPRERFSALTRLDHNRAISQLAKKTGAAVTDIKKMTIWGNHSATQYPDIFHAEVGGKNARRGRQRPGLDRERLHPDRRQARRGDHRRARRLLGGLGRVGDHRRRPRSGCSAPEGDWVSMAVLSDGSYGVPEGLISSFPVTTKDGNWTIVQWPGDRRVLPRPHRQVDRRTRRRRKAVTELGLIGRGLLPSDIR